MAAARLPICSNSVASIACWLAGCLFLLFYSFETAAVDEIVFQSGPVRGHGWSAASTVTRLRVAGDAKFSAVIEANQVTLPGPLKQIENISARCAELRFDASGVFCPRGEVRIRTHEGGPLFSPSAFEAAYGEQGIRFRLTGLELGGGVVEVTFNGTGEDFLLNAEGKSLPVAALLRLFDLKGAGGDVEAKIGVVSGTFSWRDSKSQGELSASVNLKQLAFSDAAGLNAGENLVAGFNLDASRRGGPWRVKLDATVTAGQIYLHPVFVDAGEGALTFKGDGTAPQKLDSLSIEKFSIQHQGVGELDGSAALSFDQTTTRLERLNLETNELALARFHATYIKPWLLESAFSKLTASGNANVRVEWSRAGSSSATLALGELNLEDEGGRFGVLGLKGDVHWNESGAPRSSRLGFESARFYRIDLGSAEVVGTFAGSDFRLSAPLDLPLLGGALHINDLEATGLGGEQLAWRMRGEVKPISLEALTSRLEWPPFSGSLSGDVPSLRYADGELSVDGKLNVRAFDGRVELEEVRLKQPFGVVPRLTADILIEKLSLGALTSTFSFGSIEGRLSGRIDGLVLESWRPAAFDARFATPENDDSRHRISQRAIKNLARLGGAGEVLSSVLFKFFQTFSYDRLGISCRLENGVCQMGGVEDAERGYYIVKGGGLPPRIDVFGFNTIVDWSTLIDRLKAITRANEAVIR